MLGTRNLDIGSPKKGSSLSPPGIPMGFYAEELDVQERLAMYFILRDQLTWLPQLLSYCKLYMLNIVPAYLLGSLNEILEYFKGLRLSDAESDHR